IVSTPAEGAAVVRTAGSFSGAASVTLGRLAPAANVKRLALDLEGITVPQGYDARLKRSGDSLVLRVDRLGGTIIIR
ncbi:MAG: hypothetical protein IJ658_05680, partial [Kiritimatiellae bacterium]|nr:hypothetical protein [Kiritimatiellia bacterium]